MDTYCQACGESCDSGEVVCRICDRELHLTIETDSDPEEFFTF